MTTRYMDMQKRVTILRKSLLPANFSDTGLYSDRVHHRVAAFRLLVHAEFESYLEGEATDHVTRRMDDWTLHGKPSITLAALLAYDETEGKPPSSLLAPPQKPSGLLADRLAAAVGRFNHQARVLNHGIRENNVLSMVLPLGLEASQIDTAWLADLDGWARERGEFAHRSSVQVRQKLDPAREYAKSKSLLLGFKRIGAQIHGLP